MDGASKFVKGDAIAGLIITIVNIVAGIVIGMTMMNLTAGQAVEKFSILTIGDGLVSQIPSLMISIGAGMLVTKARSKENQLAKNFHANSCQAQSYFDRAIMVTLYFCTQACHSGLSLPWLDY